MNLLIPQPHPKESNREYACRVLRMNIMTFRLKPGEPLSEIELAKLLQMSRTPVHEAITTLHNDWLIEIFPQRGTQVSPCERGVLNPAFAGKCLIKGCCRQDRPQPGAGAIRLHAPPGKPAHPHAGRRGRVHPSGR